MARPSKGTPITPEERQQIIDAIRGGKSRYAVAKEFRRSRTSVAAIAREAGLDSVDTSTAKATQARERYATAQRIELINKFFERIEQRIDNLPDDPVAAARAIRDLSTSLGIAIDKRRLEDGDATERAETVTIIDDIPRE